MDWLPPLEQGLKLNGNNVFCESSQKVACSGIIRDHRSQHVASFFGHLAPCWIIHSKLLWAIIFLRIFFLYEKKIFYIQHFLKYSKITPVIFSSFLSLFSSHTIHFIFVSFWPEILVTDLVEVHCCSGSLAAHGFRRGWCCGVTAKIFFSTTSICLC